MAAGSFVVLVGDDAAALQALCDRVAPDLSGAGWTARISRPFLRVYAPTDSRLEITEGFDGHGVVVGDVFAGDGRALSLAERQTLGAGDLDNSRAADVVANHWGRYVLVRRGAGTVSVLRDPSGAIEAIAWRRAGVTVIAPDAPAALLELLPTELEIDWPAVAAMVRRPNMPARPLALRGLTPIAAGERLTLGPDVCQSNQVWKPAEIYRRARRLPPPDLRATVDRAVRALAGGRPWVVEVSGGLDSAIVCAALTGDQRARATAWINHHAPQPEGDERPYARSVVETFSASLTEVAREGLTLSAERLAASAEGFRPALNDLDPDYNDDTARRIADTGAWGSLTGQGGDAVFYQMASFLIAFDEVFERGWRFRPGVVHRVARWTGRSVWPAAWLKAWREHRRLRQTWDHPWLDDLRDVPPAKALQISALVACQTFQGGAVRNRVGPCVNPLLSQPVMEAGLTWSAVDLTWGGRDRAAARTAYRDVLPPGIFHRRSKGELGAFYGQAVADHLPFLRPYLLDGALAGAGLIGPDLEPELTRESLLWRGGFSKILTLALTEAWVRRWSELVSRRQA